MIKKVQGSIKANSASFALLTAKLLSGLILGLMFALVIKTLSGSGSFVFVMTMVVITGAFFKMSSKWKFTGVLLFDLFCAMTALMLRMYIHVAPGA